MTDYTKLVEALRCKRDDCEGCDLAFLDNDEGWICQYAAKDDDAAAAIEELQAEVERLQAENPIVETVLVDKMRQQMEETVCHCNVKENAELIAKILDDDVDRKVFELPKRGEWKITTEKFTPELICSKCNVHIPCVAGWCMDAHMNYCPNCGAKMEGQE